MKSTTFLFFCILFWSKASFSQQKNENTSLISSQINESVNLYHHYIGAESRIYNGRQYLPYVFLKEGSPFYLSDTLANGWISYDGSLYSLPLQYDVARQQVIISNFKGPRLFLQNELIDSFHFLNHTFKRLEKEANPNIKNTGFYDILYQGSVEVWAHREKRFTEKFKDDKVLRVFYNYDRFYIYKNGLYHLVKNENDVFRVLGGKRREVTKLMRRKRVKFRRHNFEEALIMAATFFDQIKR